MLIDIIDDKMGDIDYDGVINVTDATDTQKYIVQVSALT